MLRRAASNAYSWWWASHIRTSQSKWLQNILREMDDRVKSMLKIIEEDADSFSKKAELYFKKRPELIKYVEETYKAYRALAERYDHISGELHKANHTIATAFPDQVQFDELDEDDDHLPKAITSIDFSSLNRLDGSQDNLISNKKGNPSFDKSLPPPKIDKSRVPEEIDRIQKEILVLQTEKEFIRSSYENAIAKYQEIEKQLVSMQEELNILQDEFGESVVIEDDEARTLMATAALRSCEDTLLSLQENQKRSAEFTRIGSRRIMMAKERLRSFKEDPGEIKIISEEIESLNSDGATDEVPKQNQVPFQIGPDMSLVELAEKINELVNKVISLELTTSSQNAQIESLRIETDELHKHVESLEEEKLTLIEGSGISSDRLKQIEEESQKNQAIKKCSHGENADASISSDDGCLDTTSNSEKLQCPKYDEASIAIISQEKENTLFKVESQISQDKETTGLHDESYDSIADEANEIHENVDYTSQSSRESGSQSEQDDSLNMLQSLLNGAEDKEKILLTEYTSILRNYKQIKRRLSEVEQKNQNYVLETKAQLVELKKANDIKDEEIKSMQLMLGKQRTNPIENELEASNEKKTSSLRDSIMSESTSPQTIVKKDLAYEVTDTSQATSHVEEKFRKDIDALLDENLDFWLRFSSFIQQLHKFQLQFDDLQAEIKKLNERTSEDGSGSGSVQSDSEPMDKQLRELKTELQVWLEQNDLLKGESQTRFNSLCNIQEEISGALASSLESDGVQLSPYQAAKFQGEVSNMQHENNKVATELEAGLDHVKGLRTEVDKILSEFHKKFELSSSQGSRHHSNPFRHFPSKTHIPLRNFLFGVKPKKKPSIFRCVNPAYQKQYSDLSSAPP